MAGKATCDGCRSKKRKYWGNKQVESADLLVPSPLFTRLHLSCCPQTQNETLRGVLEACQRQNDALSTEVQRQAQEIAGLKQCVSGILGNPQDGRYQSRWVPPPQAYGSGTLQPNAAIMPQPLGGPNGIDVGPNTHDMIDRVNVQSGSTMFRPNMIGMGSNAIGANSYSRQPTAQLLPLTPRELALYNVPFIPPSNSVKDEVDVCALLQDGSLIDYAFQSVQDLDSSAGTGGRSAGTGGRSGGSGGSCSFVGSGQGSGAVTDDNSVPALAEGTELVKHNYVRSLKYGLYFEDPQVEEAFQEQMTLQRRLPLLIGSNGWFAFAMATEVGVKYFFPGSYHFDTPDLVLVGLLMFFACSYASMLYYEDTLKQRAHLLKVRIYYEGGIYLVGMRFLWICMAKFYNGNPAEPEDAIMIGMTLCILAIALAWVEMSPLGSFACVAPLWASLMMMPGATLMCRVRVTCIGMFLMWFASVFYKNNREAFITRVRLEHSQAMTAELKQDQESAKTTTMKY